MIWIAIIIILAVIAIGIGCESIRENRVFQVTRYHIRSPKITNGIRIAFLSDLHNRSYGVHNDKLLKAIEVQNPDLILIGGDMLVGRSSVERFDEVVELVMALAGRYPIFYANGNHEQRMKEDLEAYGDMYERYMKKLKGLGIHFLANQTETILIKGQALQITALEIFYKCYTKGFNTKPFSPADMEQCIGKKKSRRYHILLAHNPMYMETYKGWGADMILSGHLHGGAVRIPCLGGIISPQMRLFPKYSGGHIEEEDMDIITSRGLGSHSIPLRIFNVPELVVIQLKGEYNETDTKEHPEKF